jgi:ABC-2 type transport system permease protein
MRSFAEEKRSQTIDILLASPTSSAALVLGKYLAIFVTYICFWLPTLLYGWALRDSGSVEGGTLFSGYLGVFLIGASSLAIGVLTSALASNQIVALMLASSLEFGLFVLGLGEYIFESGFGQELGAYVSMTNLLDEMSRGIVDSRRLVFHLSLAVWSLFVSTTLVESWRSEA